MKKTYQKIKLGEVCELINGGAWKQTEYMDYGLPVVQVSNMKNGTIDVSDLKFLPPTSYDRYKKHTLKEYDLVIATVGSHATQASAAGRATIVKGFAAGMLLNQNAVAIRSKSESLDQKYLGLIAHLDKFQFYLGTVGQGAANQVRIALSAIKEYKCDLPLIGVQRRIVDVLSAYDDLIDNNRKRIQLLEESARLLFREWFVYFRFPLRLRSGQAGHEKACPVESRNSTGVKIVDGVPEGWRKEKINKLVSLLGGHAFKGTSYQQEGKYGIVTIKNVQQGSFIPECTDYLEETPNVMRKHCFLSNGDILMSLTGNVGRVCLVYGENFLLNQRVAKIESKNKIPKSFIYWMFDNPIMQKRIENLSYGSAQQNLSPIKLGEQKVILPPDPLLESFDEIVSLINIEIIQLRIQNQKLAQARDLLLPRLMIGAIEA